MPADYIKSIVTPPRPPSHDAAPARFSPTLYVGNAQHAFAIDDLKAAGVSAVLNMAPSACADSSARYAAQGIAYLALDAEDQPGYSLLELHLKAAMAFNRERQRGMPRQSRVLDEALHKALETGPAQDLVDTTTPARCGLTKK